LLELQAMGKIVPLNKIPAIVKECQNGGGTVGLITGCFDVLHVGHVRHFVWAKRCVNLLIVGLDSDRSISLSKGVGRPVFKQKIRAEVIAELSPVDYVFKIHKVYRFKGPSVRSYHDYLLRYIRPDFLITHTSSDAHVKDKRVLTKKHGVGLLLRRGDRPSSSTEIVEKIKRLN